MSVPPTLPALIVLRGLDVAYREAPGGEPPSVQPGIRDRRRIPFDIEERPEESGSYSITTQGPSRDAALENLDEAVALHNGEIGREPTDEELRELGIDPADNTTGDREPPDVLD
jgi:predicted RNase H-like HicB family nuclease